MFLLSCSDDDLNYGMNEKLMTEDDVLKAGMGDDFHLNITETAKRVFRGIRQSRIPQQTTLNSHYDERPKCTLQHLPNHASRTSSHGALQTVKLIEDARQKLVN